MKEFAKYLRAWLLVLPLCVSVAFAQTDEPAHSYTQAELDQMLAPIALYPDSLLSQILMAATYPLEVVEAAHWSSAHPGLRGDAAVRAAQDRNWDPSVTSLVAFPQILSMMDAKLDWTERLGDAFLAQPSEVMDSVQGLRARAYDAGNLESSDEIHVERDYDDIIIEPADPSVVYVPYYNPTIVYGIWWWPNYPPVYWAPWPGYHARVGFHGITWSVGIGVGGNFFFGTWDWAHHVVRIVDRHPFYYRRFDRQPLPPEKVWRHNTEHRRGVPYRSPVVRERYRPVYGSPEQRREFRGYLPRTPQPQPERRERSVPRGAPGGHPPREENRRDERRDMARPGNHETWRPNTPVIRRLPSQPVPAVRAAPEVRPHVFEGVGRGNEVRRDSERGRASTGAGPPVANRAPARQAPPRQAPPQERSTWQAPAQTAPGGSRDSNQWYRGQR